MNARTVSEPGRRVPVDGAWDVLVAGGGVAGTAAAVAAARAGASVCLVEKTCALGGLATLGNVTVWLPLCDGRGRQVIGGLPEELLKLSVADLRADDPPAGRQRIPPGWRAGGDPAERCRKRYQAAFNPVSYLLALEEMVVAAGVNLLYDTLVCAARREGNKVTHLVVETKGGRRALAGRVVIDATGDADVCRLAGEETESLDTNVLAGWFYYRDGVALRVNKFSERYNPRGEREGTSGPLFGCDDAGSVTGHVLGTRGLIRAKLAEAGAGHPGADIQPVSVPTMPCFRMTRRLVGAVSLAERDMHRWFDDTVGLTGDWRRSGPVYAIPLAALRGPMNRNLLAAGRCISAERSAWDVTRAIPACAVTGQAAGAAAALAAARFGGDLDRLPVADLQARLAAAGCLLDPALVAPAPRRKSRLP